MKKRNRIRQRGRKKMFAAKRRNRGGPGRVCRHEKHSSALRATVAHEPLTGTDALRRAFGL